MIRKLGRELDLFHFQDNAPGAVSGIAGGGQSFSRLLPICVAAMRWRLR